ncbi:hypothetical protein [uncultured Bacteroides sp.]|uniref:hypothetical protein n=1 Tax=uncultured Bacteroides sp. TaxID=162156 RepID=UPI0026098A3B|nr:hypothetical protein [uncultured Bacteroides sp.]
MKKLKEILVDHGVKEKLAKDCKASTITVRFALRGSVNTDLSRLIRKRAIDFYGGVYTK